MSYCYASDNSSDQTSSQHHYLDVMPESPLQHKLSSNNSTTTSHVRFVQKKKKERKNENVLLFFSTCVRVRMCKMNGVWRIAKKRIFFRNMIHEYICARFVLFFVRIQFSLATNIYINIYIYNEKKRNRSTCMSSLLQFMLCIDRQMDRQTVSVSDE
jgi:hypothetical protein